MSKYTNFRVVYLNLNIIYVLLAIFLLYKCIFTKLIGHHDNHKRLYALGILATISALITGYIGCSAVWFRSKAWTQIQILLNLLLTPFLILAYLIERLRRGGHDSHDQICEYVMLGLFTFGIAIIFTAYKFLEVLRKESTTEKAVDSGLAALNVMALTPRSSTPMNSNQQLISCGSVPSLLHSHWNLAPFGRVNGWQQTGSIPSVISTPAVNLLVEPQHFPNLNVKLCKSQDKDAISDSHI